MACFISVADDDAMNLLRTSRRFTSIDFVCQGARLLQFRKAIGEAVVESDVLCDFTPSEVSSVLSCTILS